MPGEFQVYNFNEVDLIVGPYNISEFFEGEAIKVGYYEDAFTMQVGASGSATRSASNNLSGYIEFILNQTAAVNQKLSALGLLDRQSGAGIVPTYLRDNNGTSLYTAENSWIKKLPDSSFGPASTARIWRIDTNLLVANIGGN